MKNYYQILGLPFGANAADIKSAYRKLAFQYHPDKTAGNKIAQEKFIEITEAYNVLSNKNKSYVYHIEYNDFINQRQAPKTFSFQDYHKDPKQYPRQPMASASKAEIDKRGLVAVMAVFLVILIITFIFRQNHPEENKVFLIEDKSSSVTDIHHKLTKEEYYMLVAQEYIESHDSTLLKIKNVDSIMLVLDSLINLH